VKKFEKKFVISAQNEPNSDYMMDIWMKDV